MFEMIISAYRWIFLQMSSVFGLGWSIVLLSCICSALMAPLMRAVAGIVRREADYQSVILPQIAAIKAKYASDMDRHAHIQALYERYGYSPLSAVKKVLPLFVQIPFLLLTYFMLKGTAELAGVEFLFLTNLGEPDAILRLRLLPSPINLLPFVMTGVNIVTVFATPGFTARDQVQAVGISLLFLVMLYTAPSALLLYWTLNNVITMVRTLAGNRGAGLRLLGERLVVVASWLSPKTLWMTSSHLEMRWRAYVAMSTFLLAGYFFVMSRLMWNLNFGICFTVMYRGMFLMMAVAAAMSVWLLWRRALLCRIMLCVSSFACIGFFIFLTSLVLFSRFWFTRFVGAANLFDVMGCLLLLWTVPYIVRGHSTYVRFFADLTRGVKTQWYLILFPAVLAVHYSFSSAMFTLPPGSVALLAVYMTLPVVVLYIILAFLFRDWISTESLFRIAVALMIGIYIVPMISFGTGVFAADKNILIRLLVLSVAVFVLLKIRRHLPVVIFMSILAFFVFLSTLLHSDETTSSERTCESDERRTQSVLGDVSCVRSNNVYLLIYDSYGHRSILEGLAIEDGKIYEDLQRNGFKIYDAYSTGADTLSSMSAAFTLSGVRGVSVNSTVAGDNVFSDFLRANGYRTSYLLNGYEMPNRGERLPGDFYYPSAAKITRPEMVIFPCLLRGSLTQSPKVFNSYTHENWMSAYYNVMANRGPSGSFVYAHNPYPEHAPGNPRYRQSDAEEQRKFKARLQIAHAEMRETLKLLENDRESIVIMAGDHGGSLLVPDPPGKWDVRNLIDHHGILLAVRWPSDYHPCLELNCLQNVMLEVLIYLTGDESLRRLAVDGETLPVSYPVGTPRGCVKNGILQSGETRGASLFEVSRKLFGQTELSCKSNP